MKIYQNRKIGMVSIIFLSITTFLLLLVGTFGMISIQASGNASTNTSRSETAKITILSAAKYSLLDINTAIRDCYIYYGTSNGQRFSKISSDLQEIQMMLRSYKSTITNVKENETVNDLNSQANYFEEAVQSFIDLAQTGAQQTAVFQAMENTERTGLQAEKVLNNALTQAQMLQSKTLAISSNASNLSVYVLLAITVLSVIISISFLIALIVIFVSDKKSFEKDQNPGKTE